MEFCEYSISNDVIFAKRSNTLVGKGIVTGGYIFDDLR